MKTKSISTSVAVAACSYALQVADAHSQAWVQVTPAGHFRAHDGRPEEVPSWYIDRELAQKVVERFSAKRTPPVLDYEHQTLLKEENGQPAPAAGRFLELEWREGNGLFARVELTERAAKYIADREYLYFSPVFLYHPQTGDVLDLQMGALTNFPAVDGMQEIALRAAATSRLPLEITEDFPVKPLLVAVIAALGLSENTTEEQATAALTAHANNLRAALGVDEAASGEALVAACTSLKAKAATAVDPAKFVSVDVVEQMKGEVAALTARLGAQEDQQLEAEIQAALDDGRLLKPMESWARDLAKKDRAALTAYLAASTPIAALTASQTQGKAPVVDAQTGLDEAELAVCTAMGVTPEAFKAAKGA